MKLPWVSRKTHEEIESSLFCYIQELEAENKKLWAILNKNANKPQPRNAYGRYIRNDQVSKW